MEFFKIALKYNAPATISGFVFFYLVTYLLGKDHLLIKNPILTVIVLLIVANFCAFLLYRSTQKLKKSSSAPIDISNNEVIGNEVGGSLNLAADLDNADNKKIEINKNKILDNKVKKDLIIGVVKNND